MLAPSQQSLKKIDSKTTWREVKERKIEVLLESLLMINSTNLKIMLVILVSFMLI